MNPAATTRRLDIVLGLLIAATLLAWWLGERGAGGLGVMLLLAGMAAAKGTLVVLDFMALRQVKLLWRALLLGWLFVVLALIALAYFSGLP